MNLNLFVFTVNEYLRFRKELFYDEPAEVLGKNIQQEYVFINIRLMLLRKYFTMNENVNLLNIAKEAIYYFPSNKNQFQEFIDGYKELQDNHTELNLFNTIEDSVYGLYYHADKNRIKNVLETDDIKKFQMTKEYILKIEKITLNLYYELRKFGVDDDIFDDRELSSERRGSNSKINKHYFGSSEEILEYEEKLSIEEHKYITKVAWDFLNEYRGDDFLPQRFEKYFKFPSLIDEDIIFRIFKGVENYFDISIVNKIHFNKYKTEAQIFFLSFIEDAIEMPAEYFIESGASFKMAMTKGGWKIIAIYIKGESMLKVNV